jgi:hypothetical protein
MIQTPINQHNVKNNRKLFLILLGVWFAINLLQALFMEISNDEAYYRVYAEHLDWGYFDHPPMIALMIRASSLIFRGILGIRFMTLLLQLGTLIITWKIIDYKEPDARKIITFFIISGSICMFTGYGILTFPDAPLLFFTALFLLAYKKFIAAQNWPVTLFLSLSIAGLGYSKYQGVLVIGFVVLSNLRLLGKFKFWFAGILALVLLSPHFYWQIANNLPSLQFHLVDRLEGFKWKSFFEYLPNQMALLNPFTLGAVIFVLLKYAPSGRFSRSLYFQIIGFIGFFWLTSFRDHVEPNWTIACSVPMIILLAEKWPENPALFRYIRRFMLPSIFIILVLRILLLTKFDFIKAIDFSGKKEKYEYIESVTKDLPVIFTVSYQDPSLYSFFTGKEATVISSVYTRQTQYDLWQFEKKYNNRPVFIVTNAGEKSRVYGSGSLQFCGFETDSLQTVNRMKISYSMTRSEFHPGDSISLPFTMENPYNYDIDFNHHQFPVTVCLVFRKGKETIVQHVSLSDPPGIISSGSTIERRLTAVIPELPDGDYKIGICLNTLFGPAYNSHFSKIIIGRTD